MVVDTNSLVHPVVKPFDCALGGIGNRAVHLCDILIMGEKTRLKQALKEFSDTLADYTQTPDGQWTIKGFIDAFKNVYTISADTKVISKILEIHLFPKILKFAEDNGYVIVLPKAQNYYPDISLVKRDDESVKFALDIKTTYVNPKNPRFCNGFTLGSHGKYFEDRSSTKNIQFPYSQYSGHFCLGIIYKRAEKSIEDTETTSVENLSSIVSVIQDITFFVCEKWRIASDSSGSGNTANIGSIKHIGDLRVGNGIFKNLGEEVFDEYWVNYGKLSIRKPGGEFKKLTKLEEFLQHRGMDVSQINSVKTVKNHQDD